MTLQNQREWELAVLMTGMINWDLIDRLCRAYAKEDPVSSFAALERYLKKWWCLKYNRPFKDPVLLGSTVDELAFEFLTHYYANPDNDPDKKAQEQQTIQDDVDWASKMVAEELKKMNDSVSKLKDLKPKSKKSKKKQKVKPIEQEPLPDISTKFDID